MRHRKFPMAGTAILALLLAAAPAVAQDAASAVDKVTVDTFWVMLAACLVLLMQAGFALLEAGRQARAAWGTS